MADNLEIEKAEQQHDRILREFEFHNQATIEVGTIAVRSMFTLNGGAAVALLAFMSGIVDASYPIGIENVATGLICFAAGVAMAALAACAAYFANFSNASAVGLRKLTYEFPYSDQTPRSRNWERAGLFFQIATIAIVAFSLGCFVYGVASLASALATGAGQ